MAYPGQYGGGPHYGPSRPRANSGPRGHFPGEFAPSYGYSGAPRQLSIQPRPNFNPTPRPRFEPEGKKYDKLYKRTL